MKTIKSEMTGTVLEIKVKEGEAIKAGQEIAILESMKMEVPMQSPASGTVSKILKNTGDFVNEGEVVFELN